MLLKEIFQHSEAETPDTLVDDVAFFCDHDDDLHKEYFLPAVDELKRKKIFEEVEAAILQVPRIQESAIVVGEKPDGSKGMVACVVGLGGSLETAVTTFF